MDDHAPIESEADTVEIWRNEMNQNLRELTKAQQEVLLEVRQRPTRQEVEMMLATKVSLEAFNLEIKGVKEDIDVLKGKPESIRAWVLTIVSVGGCLTAIVSTFLGSAIPIIIYISQHWH